MRIFALVILLPSLAVAARLVEVMSSDDMLKQADVVAVCQPVSTKPINEKVLLTNISPQLTVTGQETLFNVREVHKGDTNLKQLVLHHYRLPDPGNPIRNGPSLLDFDGRTNDWFLLYLVKQPDGRFVPVTGQSDPAFSVVTVMASNTAPGKFIGRWQAQDGLMGESDLLDVAPDYTFRWAHTDSVFQPPAITTLSGTWKQPDEFSYIVLELTNRVDHQGARLLETRREKKRLALCLRKGKLQLFETSLEFTPVARKPGAP